MKVFGMNLLTYLRALFSGQIGRWAETNDVALNEIAIHIRGLPDIPEAFFLHFLLSSNLVCERLVGYQHGKNILSVDLRVLTIDHFRHLHSLLLSYFVLVCYTLSPYLKDQLQHNLFRIVGKPEAARNFFREAEREAEGYDLQDLTETDIHYMALPQESHDYLEIIKNRLWEGVARTIPGADGGDLAGLAVFKILVSEAYLQAIGGIRPVIREMEHRSVKEVDSRGESGKEDQALRTIAARIEPLKGLDRRFAARMLQAAWEIIRKFSDIPGADFAERFAAAPSEDAVKAYKAILGQLFFTFFLPDADATKSASQLLTDTTDKDLEDTIRLWVKFEECLKGENTRFCTAAVAWKSACEAIGADASAEPVALLCFVVPWDAAMSELRGEFSSPPSPPA